MSVLLILIICGIVALLVSVSVLGVQHYRVKKHIISIDPSFDGPAQVSVTLHAVIRYLLKRSVYFRKFFMQYMFHIMVRVMYYIDLWSSMLYAKSRNWFVQNAVRNRGTVPHFWHHLKVYKQEMDQEKKGSDEK